MNEEAAKALRSPFDPASIGKLPRVTQKDGTKSRCRECGGYLPPHIHLDYVGHAAVTDRLLQVDPEWTWEPVALADDGAPLVRRQNNDATLWIRLTVAGTSRYGVGIAPANTFELEKQLISDAIRNAAMRFGVALDLWSKEDLGHSENDSEVSGAGRAAGGDATTSSPPAAASPSPEAPPCQLTIAEIDEMSPPKLMAALKAQNQRPEGSAEDWRAQLKALVQ